MKHHFSSMELTIVLEKQEEGGFTAHVPSLPGCISQGDTKREAIANIKEAIELYLEPDTNDLIEYSGEKVTVVV
jgi:predicted RNase H-like HicB family nuclease